MTAEHFDYESLDGFVADLKARGFQSTTGYPWPTWRNHIHPDFAGLTDARCMDVAILPGWPLRPPALFVQGLASNHLTAEGFVCLWREGDVSSEWYTVDGYYARISEWCRRAKLGWEDDNLAADAYLNWYRKVACAATFDITALSIIRDAWGECHGVVAKDRPCVAIRPGRSRTGEHLRGLWFHAGTVGMPPRKLSEVPGHLSRSQRKGLARALDERRSPEPFVASGGCDLILFCWDRDGSLNLLALVCRGTGAETEADAMIPGPNDESNLILRAGPDANTLRNCRATLFGAGALGGHTGVALAQSGLGHLDIVDGDLLLPGNVVRHIAGHNLVGLHKALAAQVVIGDHAPWTEVSAYPRDVALTPTAIRERIGSADIVVDTTGNAALGAALSMTAHAVGIPLVSGALYRGGAVARVRRQFLEDDKPLHLREESARYPSVPRGEAEDEFSTPETGCSAPVNNAPPTSVTACASRVAQVVIDALTGRFGYGDEIIDVYRPLPEPPFDRIGQIVP